MNLSTSALPAPPWIYHYKGKRKRGVLTTNTGVTSLSTIDVILISPVLGLTTNIP